MPNNKCNNCVHTGVCRLKEELEDFIKEIKSKKSDNFEIDVNCKHYSASNPASPIYIPSYPDKTSIKNPTVCETCPFKNESGDRCYFCPNNPLKIYCENIKPR